MSESISIHQPNFFPRLKVLQKICKGEIWVVFDDVQYTRREWQNRTILRHYKHPNLTFWLNLPIQKTKQTEKIKNIKIHDAEYNFEHIKKVIFSNYEKSSYIDEINLYITNLFNSINSDSLLDFNTQCHIELFKLINIEKKIIYSSELNTEGKNNEKIINTCKKLRCTNYISGEGANAYINEQLFRENEINITFYKWKEEYYANLYKISPLQNISFIDFVARNGLNELKNLLIHQ